jgi:hypothetical protein
MRAISGRFNEIKPWSLALYQFTFFSDPKADFHNVISNITFSFSLVLFSCC